jgi:hypothetical protein
MDLTMTGMALAHLTGDERVVAPMTKIQSAFSPTSCPTVGVVA